MRFLSTLLLLLVLPGLLLPAGLMLRLCPCAERSASPASCCGPSSCGCCVGKEKTNGNPDDRALGESATVHRDCKCPVLRGPDRKTEVTAPDRGGDPSPDLIALAPESRPAELLAPGVAPRDEAAERGPPPPDRARNLPLLL